MSEEEDNSSLEEGPSHRSDNNRNEGVSTDEDNNFSLGDNDDNDESEKEESESDLPDFEEEPELPDPEAHFPSLPPARRKSESWVLEKNTKSKGSSKTLVRGSMVVAVYEGGASG